MKEWALQLSEFGDCLLGFGTLGFKLGMIFSLIIGTYLAKKNIPNFLLELKFYWKNKFDLKKDSGVGSFFELTRMQERFWFIPNGVLKLLYYISAVQMSVIALWAPFYSFSLYFSKHCN